MIAAFALAGCTVGPDYHRPAVEVPGQFNAAATQPAASQPATTQAAATQPVVDLRRWWETFNDPALNRLIVQATASNLDVRLAAARVREARAQVLFNRAALFPTLDSSAEYSRNQLSKNAFGANAASSATTGATATGTPSLPGRTDLYRAGFDAGWELDVFGGTRRAIEAAQYTLEAQVEARRSALVTLLSEVAQNYIMLRGFQHELAIVQNNVAAQRDTLDLTRTRLQAGIATSLDVARSEAQVASTESQVPTLQTQIKQALERLAVLLNRTSADLEAELAPEAQLPGGPPQVPAGLPSELLRRRPDVRQAERQFAAATANIGVATADLFPKFNLTGSLGLESLQLKTFANSSSLFWSIGPSVSWRIFDAGQIRANIEVQNARQEQALIQYRQAVIQSLADVETALVAYDREQARQTLLRSAVEANRHAVDLAKQLNAAGLVDFLNVLASQLALYQSEDQLAQSDQAVATNLIALYKALGGGWEIAEGELTARSRSSP